MKAYDLVIIGTGMGGGALSYALRDSGRKILLLERGDYLPSEPENWSPEAVFAQTRYKPKEQWFDENGQPFFPGVHYFVGGNTKVYGAALPRLRKEDFSSIEHEEGLSPAWPVTYDEFEPYYCRAEQMLSVHGEAGIDPTEPPRSAPFPYPAVPHERYIEDLKTRLELQSLHPYFLPLGIDLRPGGRCIRCKTCDGFPCKVHAKSEADVSCVRPALESGNVELMTRGFARRLITDGSGKKITEIEIARDGETLRVSDRHLNEALTELLVAGGPLTKSLLGVAKDASGNGALGSVALSRSTCRSHVRCSGKGRSHVRAADLRMVC